ncbi:MAG: Gx transporter family protein [Clostridia bacterium]|nr:Gx transporter family protein [Clostridia bacterium]
MNKTYKTSVCGILFGLAITFSYVESLVPSSGIPGVKLGLSNIVTMFALEIMGFPYAFGIVVSKGMFAMITRGFSGGVISLAGGLLSLFVMYIVSKCKSYMLLGISGGISHNLGQICAASLLMGTSDVFWYLPYLVLSGFVMGTVTAITLKSVMPHVKGVWSSNVTTCRNSYKQ